VRIRGHRDCVGNGERTLFLDGSGTIIREIDTFPGARVTFSGNGKSFSFPGAFFMTFKTVYPEGATIGAPATVTVTGLLGHVKGIGADAGQDVLMGTVVDFAPEGFPIVDNLELVLSHGNRAPGEHVAAAVCAALGAE
jgi:hypothetical protein